MKVEIIKDFVRQGKKWKKGRVVEFTNDVAYELIESGKAQSTERITEDEELRNKVYANDEEE